MKKIYITLFSILCFSLTTIAQPILTAANFVPLVGDSQFYYVADTNSVIDNTTGANVIFDYTGLETYGMTQTQHFLDPTTTTYSSDFSSATTADSTSGLPINKNYKQAIASDSIMNVGFVANNPTQGTVVVKYNADNEKLMEFPFAYNSSFIDDYSGVFTMFAPGGIPINTNGYGQATVIADAWGSLQLPMGVTIDSVIRVNTIEYMVTDTVFLQPLAPDILPITINAEYVNYYKPSISKFPLLSFNTGTYTQDGAVIASNNAILSQYPLPTIVSVNELENTFNLSIFPNPSNNENSTLSFDLEKNATVKVEILNNLGQNISTIFNGNLQQGKNQLKINTTHLSKGLYFVNIIIDNNVITKKLIIE